jgi:hypothetical protein
MDGGSGGNFWGLDRPALIYFAKLARTPYMTGEGPVTDTLTITRSIGSRFGTYALRAQITDAASQETGDNIMAAEAYIDLPPWRAGAVAIPLTAEDGNFNSPTEFAVGNIHVPAGRHIIFVRGRDAAGNWGPVKAVFQGIDAGQGDG